MPLSVSFCHSKTIIRSVTFPVYRYAYLEESLVLPGYDRYAIFKLSYRNDKWMLHHAMDIDKEHVMELLQHYDSQIPLDIGCEYYGTIRNNDITWIAARYNKEFVPNPYTLQTSTTIQNTIVATKGRFLLVDSPKFQDYFTAVFFYSKTRPSDELVAGFRRHVSAFRDMVYDWEGTKVINRFKECQNVKRVQATRSNAFKIMSKFVSNETSHSDYDVALRELICTIRDSLFKELMTHYSHKSVCTKYPVCNTLMSLFSEKARRPVTPESMIKTLSWSNNFHKMLVIEYLQTRSKMIQPMATQTPFHLNDPYLLIAEILLRD